MMMSELEESPEIGPKPRWVKDLDHPVPTVPIYLTPETIKNLKYVLASVTEYESLTLSEALLKLSNDYITLFNYRTRRENEDKDRGMTDPNAGQGKHTDPDRTECICEPCREQREIKDAPCSKKGIHVGHVWHGEKWPIDPIVRWCKGRTTRQDFPIVQF